MVGIVIQCCKTCGNKSCIERLGGCKKVCGYANGTYLVPPAECLKERKDSCWIPKEVK